MIHPTAIVHSDARIGAGVGIGAYSVVGANVEIGEGTRIGAQVVITGPTRIGRNNRIHPFCVIGADPQDKKYRGEPESRLEIADDNEIREYCSLNRGTAGGGGVTRIGSRNWIMAYVHIAHDCTIGDDTVFANHATLAGHVTIENAVILGGFTGVHQFCRIGRHSFTAIASVIVKDVPPYLLVSGNTAKPRGLNREGLRRYQFSEADQEELRRAYRIVYRDGLLLKDALDRLAPLAAGNECVACFTSFIQGSERGIVR